VSTHPNAILLLTLTPEGLSRKTMAAILEEAGIGPEEDLKIEGASAEYSHKVMESGYDEDWQISAQEGDLIFFDLVTYGYGEVISWEALEKQKNALEEWAKGICERHHCAYKIFITANYW
jgi:hypothetical protein